MSNISFIVINISFWVNIIWFTDDNISLTSISISLLDKILSFQIKTNKLIGSETRFSRLLMSWKDENRIADLALAFFVGRMINYIAVQKHR